MTTTTRTPIADLSAAQIIKLTLDGHLILKDGAPAYSDKADKAAARNATKARRQAVLNDRDWETSSGSHRDSLLVGV